MTTRQKVLDKQILSLEKNAETTKFSITLINADDPDHYQATIRGPVDSPFENGMYLLDVQFATEYPFKPPKIKFLTRIFHPNIREDGAIYLNILYDGWTPGFAEKYEATLYVAKFGSVIAPNYRTLFYDKADALHRLEKNMNQAMTICYVMNTNQSFENTIKMYEKDDEIEKLQL
ncbi:hypothetical protein I4U23_016952 [Adineta vaga]|nr:hypothetical protein I4U23_016952 [Adineta vaga]